LQPAGGTRPLDRPARGDRAASRPPPARQRRRCWGCYRHHRRDSAGDHPGRGAW